jgi:hypothetical protein
MNMKKLPRLLSAALLCLTTVTTAGAALVSGVVRCDADHNLTNDIGDAGIAGVLVVVTNQTGTFFNSAFTAANGSFSLQIPNFDPLAEISDPLSQLYVETLHAVTLPPAAVILFPPAITNLSPTPAWYINFAPDLTNLVYVSAAGISPNGNWLVSGAGCPSGACELSGSGIIRGGSRRPEHSFHGSISSTVLPDGTRRGDWTDLAHQSKLHFQSTVVQTVNCMGSPARAIEFSGLGTLKGIDGNKARYNQVHFTLRAEDHGRPGHSGDGYYLRVYTSDGNTLLLVSGDAANPLDIVTVPISAGNLTVGGSNGP